MEVAEKILEQMGGLGKIKAMTDAYNFISIENGVQFKFRGSSRVNTIRIQLTPRDTYHVELGKVGPSRLIAQNYEKKEEAELMAEDLKEWFEEETGLLLSLW